MRWEDQAIVLGLSSLGETKKIVTLLTQAYGRHKGVWRPSKGTLIQAGSIVKVVWKGRLPEHLGTWSFEPEAQAFAYFLSNADLLIAVHSAISLCEILLPEREPALAVYRAFHEFLSQRTLKAYCYFELALLNQTSFPLDLSRCVLGGTLYEPAYVSPRTGRAVSGKLAEPYISRLLPLPFFMHNFSLEPSVSDLITALSLTGYFLERYSLNNQGRGLPPLRQRLVEQLYEKSGRNLAE